MPILSILSALAALGAGIIIGRYGCPSVPACKCPEHNLDEHEKLIAPMPDRLQESYSTPFSGAGTNAGPAPLTGSQEAPTTNGGFKKGNGKTPTKAKAVKQTKK